MSNKSLFMVGITSNVFEWYEFCISAYLALVMGHLFFNTKSNLIALLLSFSVFALSYVVRPLGSLIFGFIGDRYGSKKSLSYSLMIMTIPTCVIAFLPTYNQIGYIATVVFIFLKLLQGLAAGGELPLSASYMYKSTQNMENKYFFCSLIQSGSTIGLLLASFTVFIIYLLFNHNEIYEWAWRIPFFISIPMSITIMYIRKRMRNTVIHNDRVSYKNTFNLFIKAITISSFVSVYSCLLFIWLPSYLENFLGVLPQYAKASSSISLFFLAVFTLSFGYIYKHINYKKILLLSSTLLIVLVYPLIELMFHASILRLVLVQFIFSFLMGAIQGCFMYVLGDIFKNSSVMNMGISISYTLPTALIAGTAPVVSIYFINKYNNIYFPSLYLFFIGVIAIPVIFKYCKS